MQCMPNSAHANRTWPPPPPVVAVTVNVSGTVTEASEEETTIDPVYVPTARVPGLAETVSVAGVVPLVGFNVSHDPPLVVDGAAVKLTAVVLLTARLCEAGGDPPCVKPKARLAGVTVIVAALVTVSVTVTVTEPIEDDMATAPMYVPTAIDPGATETVTVPGVVPLAGLAESQELPLVTATVNPTADPVLLRTERLCEEGRVPLF